MRILFILLCAAWLAGCQTTESAPMSSLPPGVESVELANPGFTADANGQIPGWSRLEHNKGQSYTFDADREHYAVTRPNSMRIARYGPEPYGLTDQRLRVQPHWIGKTLRFSGYIRTRGVTGTGAALVMQARNGADEILAFDQMDQRRVQGDQEWRQVSVQFKVPPNSYWLQVGAMLQDDGAMWIDDVALERMD